LKLRNPPMSIGLKAHKINMTHSNYFCLGNRSFLFTITNRIPRLAYCCLTSILNMCFIFIYYTNRIPRLAYCCLPGFFIIDYKSLYLSIRVFIKQNLNPKKICCGLTELIYHLVWIISNFCRCSRTKWAEQWLKLNVTDCTPGN